MNRADESGHVIETEMEIAAPVEAVWKALTDAEELTRWFPLEADVEPGPEGSIRMSWGELFQGRCRIEVWEPNRRLRTGWLQPEPTEGEGAGGIVEDGEARTVVDYILEARGGTTVLRLVHSGFDRADTWHEEYDATRRGWRYELRALRHYLEHHRGTDRRVAWSMTPVDLPRERAWRRLVGGDGIGLDAAASELSEGDAYALTTSSGRELRGIVHVYDPSTDFSGTVENLNNGIVRLGLEAGPDGDPYAILWLATYGVEQETIDAIRDEFEGLLGRVFPG